MMQSYDIKWCIRQEAPTPKSAVLRALEVLRDKEESWALVFDVTDEEGNVTEVYLCGGE